jgi:hypothetical protein
MASLPDDEFMEKIADAVELSESEQVPARLKARLYSALVQQQVQTGPLMSLTETNARGHQLCVFEQLVQIAPVSERAKSLNICRVCHARVLAEHLDNPPIYWNGCPYVEFKKS